MRFADRYAQTVVDIYPGATEQLSEAYLTTISPNATVPVLVNPALLAGPLIESTDISWYIAAWYPRLLPAEHESQIRELVRELHQINAGLLTMGVDGKYWDLLLAKTRELLGQEDISEAYRKLLKGKETQQVVPLAPSRGLVPRENMLCLQQPLETDWKQSWGRRTPKASKKPSPSPRSSFRRRNHC